MKYSSAILFSLLFALPAFATSQSECLNVDFSNRMSSGDRQNDKWGVCWAYASSRLYEEQICIERGGALCGINLSEADIMRCQWSLEATPPEIALHCALGNGICSGDNGEMPRSEDYSKFEAVWKDPKCAQNRYTSKTKSILVVRGRPTLPTDDLGLRPDDDFIEHADVTQAVLQAFKEGRSSAVMYMASDYGDGRIRHAIVANGMRWNAQDQVCEVHIENSDDWLDPLSGWTKFDRLMRNAYRVSWIRKKEQALF